MRVLLAVLEYYSTRAQKTVLYSKISEYYSEYYSGNTVQYLLWNILAEHSPQEL